MSDTSISLEDALGQIADTTPLVVSYTNSVTVNDVANATLHWNGLPVMSEDVREAEDMLALASACLINMGTVNETSEERMVTAGKAAISKEIPVVFDPVGVGATTTRTRVAERILDEVGPSVIKGNYGEITALTGSDAEVRGVESVGEYAEIAETAIACAQQTDAVVVASGATDIVATHSAAYEITAGHAMMGQFVGSGCMLGVTLATFAGGLQDEALHRAVIAGTTAFGLAGEQAAEMDSWVGPASYKTAFMDMIAEMDTASANIDQRIERIAEV